MPTSDARKAPLRRDDRWSAVADKPCGTPQTELTMLPKPNCQGAAHRFASRGSNGTPGEHPTDPSLAIGRTCPMQSESGILLGRNRPIPPPPSQTPLPCWPLAGACQAAGTVSTGLLAKLLRKAQVSLRYDLGSTLELHRPHGKHNSLPRPSHHCRVYLTRGGQGHRRLRGKKQRPRSWLLYGVEAAGVLGG